MKPISILGLSILMSTVVPAPAQPVIGAKSGVINVTEGRVYLDDKLLEIQPAQFPDMKENSVLRTEEGRAEILLTPGVVLRIGENSGFRMIANRLVDTKVELLTGSAIVDAMDVAKETNVTFLYRDDMVAFTKSGIYRFDGEPARIKVFKGSATVKTASGPVAVGEGKMLPLGSAVAAAEKFNTSQTDSLDRWSRRRDELMAMSNISAANQARKAGYSNPCANWRNNPAVFQLGSWGYNPYYGFGTYIPCRGRLSSPYGYRYWSPAAVYEAFYAPRPVYNPSYGGGMGAPSYPTSSPSMGGYSGAVSSAPSGGAVSAPAAASSGSSAASSAGSSAVGGGGGASGGRGN